MNATSHPETLPSMDLVRRESWDELAGMLSRLHPADIADFIRRAPSEHAARLFSLVPADAKPDVLAGLESVAGADILDSLSNAELSEIVEDMAPDDAADVLAELPGDRSLQVLDLMETEDSRDVKKLLTYPEDSAGGIMTTNVVKMQEDQSVAEAIEAIAYIEDDEPFVQVNVINRDGVLVGYVDIWELLRQRDRSRPLRDIVHREFVSAMTGMDQEEAALLMTRYDLSVIPVVDEEGRLVGRITSDDVMDVMEEEASEDIFRLAGSDDAELEAGSALRSSMLRLPWLMVTLFGGFLTSLILRQFHAHVAGVLVLAAFVPAVLAMGGNTGIQSSTLIVRSIALGDLKGRSIGRLLLREISTGALMGCICGIVIGMWVFIVTSRTPDAAVPPAALSITVALALLAAMTFASVFGALVPLALSKLRVDPAVAAGPFITIANDISALLIYFAVILILVHRLA